MNHIKSLIEDQFEALSGHLYDHKWKVFLGICVATLAMAASLVNLQFDSATVNFFHENDPVRVAYLEFLEEFGQDQVVMVSVEMDDLMTPEGFARLAAFHQELESEVPYLEEIKSLINVTSVWGVGEELQIGGLMQPFPADQDAFALALRKIRETPLYRNLFISENERFTVLLLRFDAKRENTQESSVDATGMGNFADAALATEKSVPVNSHKSSQIDREMKAFSKAISQVAVKHQTPNFNIRIAGSQWVISKVRDYIQSDTPKFTAAAFAVIALCSYLLFHRLSGVLLPLSVVGFSLLSTLGLMAASGVPINVITQILPSFLLVVGIAGSLHVMTLFYGEYHETGDKRQAVAYAFRHSGFPILMTYLTTMAGVISFASSALLPVSHLGWFGTLGVFLAGIYTYFLLPALLAIFPIKAHQKEKHTGKAFAWWMDKLLLRAVGFGYRRSSLVIAGSLGLILSMGWGVTLLTFSHNHLAWMPESDPLVENVMRMDKELNGTVTAEFIVDTGKPQGLYQPEVMRGLQKVNELSSYSELGIGKSFSLVDTVRNLNKALLGNQVQAYSVPESEQLIAQEILLFENGGADDLARMADSNLQRARVTMKFPWRDANDYVGLLNDLESRLKGIFGRDIQVTQTGLMVLLSNIIQGVMSSMVTSYCISGVLITLFMIAILGNLPDGLLMMLPNFLPIFLGLSLMGWLGYRLDLSSILCGSLAIGLVVDDAMRELILKQPQLLLKI